MLDVRAIRELFPITRRTLRVAGSAAPQPLVYLDHAASTHPPTPVLDAHRDFLERSYANTHRGRHRLSEIATERFERVRDDIRRFISAAGDESTIILLGNATQALDLAAHVMERAEGATLVSLMEHHSNDLPHRARGTVAHFGVLADGTLDYEDLEHKLREQSVKLVALTGASNVTGFMPDIHRVARMAHAHGARVLVDAAQLLAHARIDVRPEGEPGHIDFLAAAGHKAYAPFGVAFLHAPRSLCDAAPPYVPGGGTVAWVSEEDVCYKRSPERHEGGTPNVAGAIALGTSLRFLEELGREAMRAHERALSVQALEGLRGIDGVTVLGHPTPPAASASSPSRSRACLTSGWPPCWTARPPSPCGTAASAPTPTFTGCSASPIPPTSGAGSRPGTKRDCRARSGRASGSTTPSMTWRAC